jgi:triphosphatase
MECREVSVENQKIGQSRLPESATRRRSAGTDHQEVEWQFDADDLGRVGRWLEAGSRSSEIFVESGEEKELIDTYYDTGDWRLYRAGYALRIRKLDQRRSEATMKSLTSAADGDNVRRREISEPLRGNDTDGLLGKKRPGPVGKRLKALAGTRKLHPLFEVHTRRRTFDLFEVQTDGSAVSDEGRNEDGAFGEIVQDASGNVRRAGVDPRIGEVALDESETPLGDKPVLLRRVEVEAETSEADASSGLLENFAGILEEELGLRPATASKYELGLLAKGLDPERDLDVGPNE